MSIKCLFGSHEWDSCKCKRCGRIRDEQHDWDGCRCKRCSRSRNEQHDWDGCKCLRCNKSRDEQHDWNGCKCRRCNKENHNWIEVEEEDHVGPIIIIRCDKCGKESDSKSPY